MEKIKIDIVLEEGVELPEYQTDGSSGMDLKAWKYSEADNLEEVNNFLSWGYTLNPLDRVLVRTGIKTSLPEGYEWQARPRSGLSIKKGLVAQLGTIDDDYRGDIGIILINLSDDPITIYEGDRLAQIVLKKVEKAEFNIVKELNSTERSGGFGHTGV